MAVAQFTRFLPNQATTQVLVNTETWLWAQPVEGTNSVIIRTEDGMDLQVEGTLEEVKEKLNVDS